LLTVFCQTVFSSMALQNFLSLIPLALLLVTPLRTWLAS
jgi:hypothetical protein